MKPNLQLVRTVLKYLGSAQNLSIPPFKTIAGIFKLGKT